MKKCIFDRHENGGCVYSSDHSGNNPVNISSGLIVHQTAKSLPRSSSHMHYVGCFWLQRDGLLQEEQCSKREDRRYLCEMGEYEYTMKSLQNQRKESCKF